MRVADYIADTLVRHGVQHVFLVTGGGAMHLNDALTRHPQLKWVACHHEQACAMAAESYARLSNRLAAVNVTSGPGATNAITGVFGAWTDSIPMVVISGQVRRETTLRAAGLPLRQLGDQEVDIIPMVRSITKYAVSLDDVASIRYHLEKALFLATEGRPGPVWLDIPVDVQGAQIEPDHLQGFAPETSQHSSAALSNEAAAVLARLKKADRPAILVGSGVRLAGAVDLLRSVTERLGIPLTTAWNAHDLVPDAHPCYAGRPGTLGDRAGNFTLQNADCVLVLGCRLNVRQIGYNWDAWAPHAYKVVVDIDPLELKKPTLSIDHPIVADAGEFLQLLDTQLTDAVPLAHQTYLDWCRERQRRYPVVEPHYWEVEAPINPYCFMDALFKSLPEDQIVVTGDGTACVVAFQAAVIRGRTRLYTNSGSAPMGYDLPAAVGACFATQRDQQNGRRIVCLAGDGSLQMNLQELATVAAHGLPILIFVLNNEGYHSIRMTQNTYFSDNLAGFDTATGLFFPDLAKLASAYGFSYWRIGSLGDLQEPLREVLAQTGPLICEVMLDPAQPFAPRVASRRLPDGRMVSGTPEDMAPHLPPEELADNQLGCSDVSSI